MSTRTTVSQPNKATKRTRRVFELAYLVLKVSEPPRARGEVPGADDTRPEILTDVVGVSDQYRVTARRRQALPHSIAAEYLGESSKKTHVGGRARA